MLKLFVPNLNKIAENFKNNKAPFITLFLEFIPQILIILILSLLFSVLHVNFVNKEISEKNNIYNHTIQLNNLSILSNPLYRDYNMRFKTDPLISYFKIFDKEKIIDQYFNKTNNKIYFKNINYRYRDTNKNSIDIIYHVQSNYKIDDALFTSILDRHIYEIVYLKISNEISINKKMLNKQIKDISEIVGEEVDRIAKNVSNYISSITNPQMQNDISNLCNDTVPGLSDEIKQLLKCDSQAQLFNKSLRSEFNIEDIKLDKQYTVMLLDLVLKNMKDNPLYTFSYDQINFNSVITSKSYVVFLIYYFLGLLGIFLIIYNFLIIIIYNKINN